MLSENEARSCSSQSEYSSETGIYIEIALMEAFSVSDLEICNLAYSGSLGDIRRLVEGNPDPSARVLHQRDSSKRTALHWACSSGQKEVIGYLIYRGAEVDCEDDMEWTPLIIAASAGHLDCVRMLLAREANVHSCTANGQTAVHYAASRNHIQTLTLLLDSGGPVGAQDKYGSTPLHRAASQGHSEVTRLLLSKPGVDPNLQDSEGNTSLHLAAEAGHGEILSMLREGGGRMDIRNKEGKTVSDLLQ